MVYIKPLIPGLPCKLKLVGELVLNVVLKLKQFGGGAAVEQQGLDFWPLGDKGSQAKLRTNSSLNSSY